MMTGRSIFLLVFALFTAAAASAPAQTRSGDIENDVTKTLLKKDLRQAVREAESSTANDLNSLLRRLTLYRRAANFEKVAQTARQIIGRPDFNKNLYQTRGFLEFALSSEYFQDAETLRFFLQNAGFNENIYARFVKICLQNKTACDVRGFDAWLAQKAAETEKSSAPDFSDKFYWTFRQIDWRRQFGLDVREITNRFVENVRNDPADLEAALVYLKFFTTSADLEWLAENFSSPQAYSYYEIGERIGNLQFSFPSPASTDEPLQVRRAAVRFLLKSLETPFNEKDVSLIYAYRLRYTSIPPKIGNYEKQLRFWTKEALAENYKNIGEAQNAQPLVEELTKLDKSDILSETPSFLAGAVQDASGARVVESEILRQQALRQDSYQYWQERIAYYDGRNEPELVFSSYLQAFSAVPFDPVNGDPKGMRIFFIRHFADFAERKFGQNSNEAVSEDWSPENKRRHQFWKDAESFLRGEFEKTKQNVKYSYELGQIIAENDFDNLADEIVGKNPEILTNAANAGLLMGYDRLLGIFLESENVSPAKKDAVFDELLRIADRTEIKKAWVIFELFTHEGSQKYHAKLVPLFEKHFAKSLEFAKAYKPTEDDDGDFSKLPEKYAEPLFHIYLAANDRKSAEKLLFAGYYSLNYGIKALIGNAARQGAFDEALRYWKLKANLNRLDLEDLDYLKRFPVFAQSLREFYTQMKTAEPYSPVPALALQILK
jgi:hypothetical protein